MVKRVLWVITFALSVLFALNIYYEYFRMFPNWSFRDIRDMVIFFITTLGLYSYVFKKHVLSQRFWRYFFWFLVLDLVLTYSFYLPGAQENQLYYFLYHSESNIEAPTIGAICLCIISPIILISQVYSTYRLGYSKSV